MDHRSFIYKSISKMLDNPDECGIYPTTACYDELEAYCDRLTAENTALGIEVEDVTNQSIADQCELEDRLDAENDTLRADLVDLHKEFEILSRESDSLRRRETPR